jgi:hypothetical protein
MKNAEENFIMGIIRNIWGASRKGSTRVKMLYSLNILWAAFITVVCFGIWALGSNFIFPEFSPFSYWNLIGGNLLSNALTLAVPVIIYAVFNGGMDLFDNDDDRETILSENIVFKGIVALSAGIFEELLHRGVLIWFGLIFIYLDNRYFNWVLALILAMLVLEALGSGILTTIVMLVVAILVWTFVSPITNPIYQLNGLVLSFYQWIAGNAVALYVVYAIAIILTIIETNSLIENGKIASSKGKSNGIASMLTLLAFLVWAGYSIPKGVNALSNLPIIPAGADHWTFLLYVGAVIWTNVKFREGHEYQGPMGKLHSYIFGFYMIYVAFTFGLVYAIIIHFAYDLFLFASEHLAHIIKSLIRKNERKANKQNEFNNQ